MRLLLLPTLAASCIAAALHAQRIQLNAPLAREVSGDVLDQRVDSRGKFVVYATDPGDTGWARLERASLIGAGPVVDLGVSIREKDLYFELSPDGTRVVYLSSIDGTERFELHSTASDGSGAAVRLDSALPGAAGVKSFRISRDSQWVVYTADQEVVERLELFAVPIAGGESNKVNGPLFSGGYVGFSDFVIAPDSRSVFYRANPVLDTAVDLYRGSVSGRQPVLRISSPHAAGQAVVDFQLSPDGGRVVYRADSLVNDKLELFSAPADASAPPVALHPGLIGFADVKAFRLIADGKSVVYGVNATLRNTNELFVVPLLGQKPPLQLESRNVADFQLDPRGRRVVFSLVRDVPQLLSVPLDGSSPAVRIDLDDRPDLGPQKIEISPDGGRVLYFEVESIHWLTSVYSSPIDASEPPLRIAQALVGETRLTGFGADGRRAVIGLTSYLVDGSGPPLFLGGQEVVDSTPRGFDQVVDGDILLYKRERSSGQLTRTDLYRVSIDRSLAPAQVNPPFGPGATVDDVVQFHVAAGANRAVYATRSGEIFGVELDGNPAPIRLNPDEADRELYGGGLVSPDGRWVVFVEDDVLFAVPFSGERAPVAIAPNGDPLVFTPDSRRLLFFEPQGPGNGVLFSVPLDGSLPPVNLTGALDVVFLAPPDFVLVTPDSSRVVSLALGDGAAFGEVFSVPCDGSTPAIDLGAHLTPASLTSFKSLQLSPDGRHVVCTGADGDPEPRLLAIPVDGSIPPVTLERFDDAQLGWFAIDPTSGFVVISRRHPLDAFTLHRVPILGGATPMLLLPLTATSGIEHFELSADGQRVVFIGDLEIVSPWFPVVFVYDVFSVPVDGSLQVQQLNDLPAGPGWAFGDRHGNLHTGIPLFLGPDGQAVFPEGESLESVHASGGSAPVALADRDADLVESVSFSLRGRSAVFELPTAEGSGLYAATTDGSRATRLLSGIPAPGGDVLDFRITADGSRVVYRGDLDEDGVDELFLSFLEQPRRLQRR